MPKQKSQKLIDALEKKIEAAPGALLSLKLCEVNRKEILDMLDALKNRIEPEMTPEVRAMEALEQEKEAIIFKAAKKVDKIIGEAGRAAKQTQYLKLHVNLVHRKDNSPITSGTNDFLPYPRMDYSRYFTPSNNVAERLICLLRENIEGAPSVRLQTGMCKINRDDTLEFLDEIKANWGEGRRRPSNLSPAEERELEHKLNLLSSDRNDYDKKQIAHEISALISKAYPQLEASREDILDTLRREAEDMIHKAEEIAKIIAAEN